MRHQRHLFRAERNGERDRAGSAGGLAGRAVRFDVVGTAYAIVTNNPAQPLVSSLTVVSDANGVASVIIQANANVPTQFAQLTGHRSHVGAAADRQLHHPAGHRRREDPHRRPGQRHDHRRLQGRVLDRVRHRLLHLRRHAALSRHVDVPELDHAGQFDRQRERRLLSRPITNGSCVDPLTFSILDATGRQTTATLINVEGTADVPVVTPPALAVVADQVTPATAVQRAAVCPRSWSSAAARLPTTSLQTSAATASVPPVTIGRRQASVSGSTSRPAPIPLQRSFSVRDSELAAEERHRHDHLHIDAWRRQSVTPAAGKYNGARGRRSSSIVAQPVDALHANAVER